MGYEIDFLPVGDNSSSGDAICIRYGSAATGYRIHVVDGGFKDCGDVIIGHIENYYGSPQRIENVVLTHADNDHAGGLLKVVETYDVGALWMNRPWLYADEIVHHFKYGWTAEGLREHLRELYPALVALEEAAEARSIPIYEVFQGTQIGAFQVLAPSRERYLGLVPQFDKTPAAKDAAPKSIFETLIKAAVKWVKETWTGETLSDNPEPTSASNESSVIQIGIFDGRMALLTGDAGPDGLNEAAAYAEAIGVTVPGLRFVQVPHHGSRRNVTPSVLDRWLGQPLSGSTEKARGTAFCSAAKDDEDHPRKKVQNAFLRRGYPVHTTKGQAKRHYHDMPERDGWSASQPHAFAEEVEE